MLPLNGIDEITHVIQLAVAPVFLLTAVGTLLNVLASRLGRAVDRGRVLNKLRLELAGDPLQAVEWELSMVARRIHLIYAAIVLAVLCALFICMLIAVAFIDAFLAANLARVLGVLFIVAMLALIASLLVFLREIFLGVSSARRSMRRQA